MKRKADYNSQIPKLNCMKLSKLSLFLIVTLFLSVLITGCTSDKENTPQSDKPMSANRKDEIENEAWKMEEKYWDYVKNIDTNAYKNLWHDDFIGYPSFGDGVSDKSKIAFWIPELHQDPNLIFDFKLYKKAVNAIDDMVIVFYDADEIWRDKNNNVVRQETFKFTHTWKKYDSSWLILGGMAAKKNQDVLND